MPYRGESLALTDLLGGQAQVVFATIGSSIQYVKAGTVRALAMTTAARRGRLPDVPPLSHVLPGYEATSWNGLCAPKNTPAEIVALLNNEVNAALADPKIKERFAALAAPRCAVAGGLRPNHRRRHREVGQGRAVLRRARELNPLVLRAGSRSVIL